MVFWKNNKPQFEFGYDNTIHHNSGSNVSGVIPELGVELGWTDYPIILWEDTEGLIRRYPSKMYPNVSFEGVKTDVVLQNERGCCLQTLTKYFPILRLIHRQKFSLDRKREIFLKYVELKERETERQNLNNYQLEIGEFEVLEKPIDD